MWAQAPGIQFIEIEAYQKVARNTRNSATREPRPQGPRDTRLALRVDHVTPTWERWDFGMASNNAT